MKTRSLRALSVSIFISAGSAALGPDDAMAQENFPPGAPWASAPLAYYPAVPAASGWVTGAGIGSLFGAMVSASNPVVRCAGLRCIGGFDPRPILLGAVIGGLIGHAESQPRALPVVMAPAGRSVPSAWWPAGSPATVAVAPPAAPSDASATTWFFEHWQRFAAPPGSGSGAAGPAASSSFVEHWQRFAER